MSNLTVENVYLRQEAKQLATRHRWTLIGMYAIFYAIIYAISYGGGALLSAIFGEPYQLFYGAVTLNDAYWLGYIVLFLISTLVSSGLALGLTCATIDLARDTHIVRISDLFGRMSSCFKAFRLSLWVGLKACLWGLPGAAVIFWLCLTVSSAVDADASSIVLSVLPFAVIIGSFVPMVPALYRYMLSTCILADAPETGVRECVNRSKAMMKGHKWQFFKLPMPFILALFGLMLAVLFVMSLITGFLVFGNFPTAITLLLVYVAIIALVLVYIPRVYMCSVLFYLKRVEETTPAADAVKALPADETPAADVADTNASDTADVSAENVADEE